MRALHLHDQSFLPRLLLVAGVVALALGAAACDDAASSNVAPSATTLEDAKPKSKGATELRVGTSGSKVDFMMDAPNEKIRGRVHDATRGELQVDLTDITKTTGHLYVDLASLELYQRKKGDDGTFGEESKSEMQNEHARNWLEIGPCDGVDDEAVCKAAKKKNENVELVITKVESSDAKDVTKLTGDRRTVRATVTGDFLLHQKKTTKSAKVEVTFVMKGERVEALHVKTVEPFAIGLAEHDVRPRTAFGKLAAKTLDALVSEDKKVAKDAEVTLDFTAEPSK